MPGRVPSAPDLAGGCTGAAVALSAKASHATEASLVRYHRRPAHAQNWRTGDDLLMPGEAPRLPFIKTHPRRQVPAEMFCKSAASWKMRSINAEDHWFAAFQRSLISASAWSDRRLTFCWFWQLPLATDRSALGGPVCWVASASPAEIMQTSSRYGLK